MISPQKTAFLTLKSWKLFLSDQEQDKGVHSHDSYWTWYWIFARAIRQKLIIIKRQKKDRSKCKNWKGKSISVCIWRWHDFLFLCAHFFSSLILLFFKYSSLTFPPTPAWPPALPTTLPFPPPHPPPCYCPCVLFNCSYKPFTLFPWNSLPSPFWSLSAFSQFLWKWHDFLYRKS